MKPQALSLLLALLVGCGGPSIEPKTSNGDSTTVADSDGGDGTTNGGTNDGESTDDPGTNNSQDGSSGSTNGATDGADDPDQETDETDHAPRILRFDSSVDRLSENGAVTFTVVVTDPDGIDDLIGGTLSDTDSGRSYGSFSTAAAEGSYSLTLTWDELNETRPINFADSEDRGFEAEFYDVAGNTVTETLTVELHCYGESACGAMCGLVGCDGYCYPAPLDHPDHCGSCGNECTGGEYCDTSGDTPTCMCEGDTCD